MNWGRTQQIEPKPGCLHVSNGFTVIQNLPRAQVKKGQQVHCSCLALSTLPSKTLIFTVFAPSVLCENTIS